MKILVLVAAYPDGLGTTSMMFAHIRNQCYIQHGIDVTVLNFSATSNYVLDEIPVITFHTYKMLESIYDIAVCHAPNLRNHYRFLIKYGFNIHHFIFIFHGQEILRINATYPKPYPFANEQSRLKVVAQERYDDLKFFLWRCFLCKVKEKSKFIFVSRWLYSEFCKNLNITDIEYLKHSYIIHNSVAPIFEQNNYNPICKREYDFITIRSHLDKSVYCIDLVNNFALQNPLQNFLIIGKGQIFSHISKAENITWLDKTLNHDDIPIYLDQSSCGLMPSRSDTQGVMACEMATYGIPMIVSNHHVCQEIFCDYRNVATILNEEFINLMPTLSLLQKDVPYKKNERYFTKNTIDKEIALFEQLIAQSSSSDFEFTETL